MNYTVQRILDRAEELAEIDGICFSPNDMWSAQSFVETMQYGFVFGIIDNGKIIGYACITLYTPQAYLMNIAVLPEYRRHGCGRLLLQYAIDFSKERECNCMTLDVRVDNNDAIALYKAFGFEIIAIRKGFYNRTTDAYTMAARI